MIAAVTLLAVLQLALTSVRVVDGDTIHDNVRGHDYRLAGVDAPETLRARCPAEAALGEVAARRVRELLDGAALAQATPAHDPAGRRRWPVDGFGRRIARITVDGVDLGEILVAEGLARRMARSDDRGDWCAPPG